MLPDGFEPLRDFNCSCTTPFISTWYAPVFTICHTYHPTHNTTLNFSFCGNENQLLSWRLPVGISNWPKQLFRDLKPENVLIWNSGYIKLTDFGLAKLDVIGEKDAKTLCEILEYLAPETSNTLFQLHIESRFNTCYLV